MRAPIAPLTCGNAIQHLSTVTNNNDLRGEGQAQQHKAEAERNVAKKEAEAEQARAKSEAYEAEQRAHQHS